MKIKCLNHHFCDKCHTITLFPRKYELCEECDKKLNQSELTDFRKLLNLLDKWGMVNENLPVFENEDEQVKGIWVLNGTWVFDKHDESFLYVEDVEYNNYLHRGGELKQFSGREHLYED